MLKSVFALASTQTGWRIKSFSCWCWCNFGASTRTRWASLEFELSPLNALGYNYARDADIFCIYQQNFKEMGIGTLWFSTAWERVNFQSWITDGKFWRGCFYQVLKDNPGLDQFSSHGFVRGLQEHIKSLLRMPATDKRCQGSKQPRGTDDPRWLVCIV